MVVNNGFIAHCRIVTNIITHLGEVYIGRVEQLSKNLELSHFYRVIMKHISRR